MAANSSFPSPVTVDNFAIQQNMSMDMLKSNQSTIEGVEVLGAGQLPDMSQGKPRTR